jgi:anti-sigma regulatory factor (Ser/Thr protein kinase)
LEHKIVYKLPVKMEAVKKIPVIIEDFSSFITLSEGNIFNVNLILGELITNIIKHAYKDNKEHYFQLFMNYEPNDSMVEMIFIDDGIPFDPVCYPLPDVNLPIEKREIGKLGICLVRNIADFIEYKRENGINKLIVRKKLE